VLFRSGTSSGTCASGFGVCCTFTLGCGGITSENTTYFQSSSSSQPAGQCGAKICPCNSDVCQLRLDLNTFVITGPTTMTVSAGKSFGGSPIGTGGPEYNSASNCFTDQFSMTGVSGALPPVMCGTNSGYHLYADASPSCNTLDFQLGSTAVGTTIATRSWNIKVTQISCLDANKAPSGCTQYFFGSTTGTITSFNYVNSYMLANQKQTICIRRERGYCKVCYTQSTTTSTDFQISGKTALAGFTKGGDCCNYGTAGVGTMGYDCVIIPGAAKVTSPYTLIKNQAFCGGLLVKTHANAVAVTICSSQTPFKLDFITDSMTVFDIAQLKKGFTLTYFQTTC